MTFRENLFRNVLLLSVLYLTCASYVRFIVMHDYMVVYEGACDPLVHSCFVGCEDDTCSEHYYYARVQKYAPNVEQQCGTDITDCANAGQCIEADKGRCSVTYCDRTSAENECASLPQTEEVDEADNYDSGQV